MSLIKHIHCVLVAGGSGRRFGDQKPKQFFVLNGKPVLAWSLETCIDVLLSGQLIIVAHPQWINATRELAGSIVPSHVSWSVVQGGAHRQDSCRNGLSALRADDNDIVLIHDAARPLADKNLISRVIQAAKTVGAAIPAIPANDSLVRTENSLLYEYLDRQSIQQVQTPQGFKFGRIYKVHCQAEQDEFFSATDDGSIVMRYGYPVAVVPGHHENIKITTPDDLEVIEMILRRRNISAD